ncbi:MAG: hypothetical protein E6K82_13840 [Candidatus Rokuibacteriota bacterium]|nr:MAG: hypothetical protein E6K82_13840 [Candidatus Rokubacteria bacterium]
MKPFGLAVMLAVLLLPGVALAGSATDAALGLGAFAVFNQILSGTGVFGALAAPAPVVVASPPVYAPAPVYVAPPAPVYVTPPRPVYVAPPPPPVAYYPAPPVYYGPRFVYAPRYHGWGHRWDRDGWERHR